MEIESSYLHRDSAAEFSKQLSLYLSSGAGLVHVRAEEILRALTVMRQQLIGEGMIYQEWDVVSGFREFTPDTINMHHLPGDGNINIVDAFTRPLEVLRKGEQTETPQVFVFTNMQGFLDNNAYLNQLLLQYSHILPSTNIGVILVTPDKPLPEGTVDMLALEFKPPGLGELREALENVLSGAEDSFDNKAKLSEEELDKVCYVGAGMTKNNFEMYVALSATEASCAHEKDLTADILTKGVSAGKVDVINRSDILELWPAGDMSNVGGLENLKDWVQKRKLCYSDEAKEFGIETPKGILLVGIPGVGKSLVSRCISDVFGVPLLRLDLSRIYSSLVGSSEARIRNALQTIENCAPCCVAVEEIEKALAGSSGSNDSGVSSRVLGVLLTWLQECTAPCFMVFTANSVTSLPPELLRRGRLDATFAVLQPNAKERKEVLAIHLRLRKRNIKDFPTSEVDKVITRSNGYVPAEIESAVKDGLIDAFSEGEEFEMRHVYKALENMIPLSKSFAPQIAAITEWSQQNAILASRPEVIEQHVSRVARRGRLN